jgi:hypothetical protein
MEKIAVLFNGLKIDYAVWEKALGRAKDGHGKIEVVFIIASRDKEPGYAFPHDLESAENLTGEKGAEKNDARIVQDFVKQFEKDASIAGIAMTSIVLEQPSRDFLVQMLQDYAVIKTDRFALAIHLLVRSTQKA